MNTLDFVRTVIQKFTDGQIAIWLFGGWAEELHGERSPGQHHDVDLLYPATDFHQLDEWLSVTGDLLPIQTKRFSHKRAVLYEQIMIEVLLLEPQSESYVTHFFDGKYHLTWPKNILNHLYVDGHTLPVASSQALQLYRKSYHRIAQTYQAHLQELRRNPTRQSRLD